VRHAVGHPEHQGLVETRTEVGAEPRIGVLQGVHGEAGRFQTQRVPGAQGQPGEPAATRACEDPGRVGPAALYVDQEMWLARQEPFVSRATFMKRWMPPEPTEWIRRSVSGRNGRTSSARSTARSPRGLSRTSKRSTPSYSA
jgi:hypothetical protein